MLNDSTARFVRRLHDAMTVARSLDSLDPVVADLAAALQEAGIPLDRLQLPLSFLFGLKHPVYAGIILTWTSTHGSSAWYRTHHAAERTDSIAELQRSPFRSVALSGEPWVRYRRDTPEWEEFPILRDLARQGYTDYVATSATLPDGARQVFSAATLREEGFPPGTAERLSELGALMSLALYGIYQAQTSRQIASTYLGRRTGARVLAGEMARGASAHVEATVAFVDVRGFTRLSAEVPVDRVVELLNAAFEVVDRHAQAVGGEILKFMGDAALIVFPHDAAEVVPCFDILAAMAAMVDEVHARTEALGQPLRVGVGLHAGEVMYGNVGAAGRHDFTVLGHAVNLTARLETLSKELDACVVVSEAFVTRCAATCASRAVAEARLGGVITEHRDQHVAGLDAPLVVWSWRRR